MPLVLDLNAIRDPALRRQLEAIVKWAATTPLGGGASTSPSNTSQSASEPFVTSAADIQLLDENYVYWAALATDTVLDALARIRWSESAGQFQFDTGTTTRMVLESTGHFGVGTTAPSAMVHALANSDSTAAIIAQGHTLNQSADLLACLTSASAAVATINADGRITAGGPAPVVTGALFSADGATTPGDGAAYYMKNASGHLWRMLLDNTVSRVTISPHITSNWLLRLSTNPADPEAVLAQSWATDIVALAARAFPGQTAALQEWQSSSAVALASMSSSGVLTAIGLTIPTGAAVNSLWYSTTTGGVGAWGTTAALGVLTGSGTINALPKFTAATVLGDSAVTDNATTFAVADRLMTLTRTTLSAVDCFTIGPTLTGSTHSGTTNLVKLFPQWGSVGAGTPNLTLFGMDTGSVGSISGTWGTIIGSSVFTSSANAAALYNYKSYSQFALGAARTITTFAHYYAEADDQFTTAMTFGTYYGFALVNTGSWGAGGTATDGYGVRIDDPDFDGGGGLAVTNWRGAAIEGNVHLKNDTYLAWGAAHTTVIASRAAGIKWNNGSSRIDFEVGTTVRASLSATVLALTNGITATTFNGLTISTSTGTLTITNGKTVSVTNTLTLGGTDGSTVAFGAGGTVVYTSNKLSALAATTSAELAGIISDETGSGALVFANTPTLVTPLLGTPTSGTLTNCTGLPIATGVSGLGTGVATFLATPSSANLAAALTDETGSGAAVFGTNPTLTGVTVSGDKLLHSGVLATIKSTQTTAPTVAAGAALGSGPTVSVQAGSTDICGLINLTAGTSTTTGTLCTLTFNGTYGGAPKMVIIGYAGTASAVPRPYVSSTTTTTFVVTAAVAPTASAVCSLYYFVIE